MILQIINTATAANIRIVIISKALDPINTLGKSNVAAFFSPQDLVIQVYFPGFSLHLVTVLF